MRSYFRPLGRGELKGASLHDVASTVSSPKQPDLRLVRKVAIQPGLHNNGHDVVLVGGDHDCSPEFLASIDRDPVLVTLAKLWSTAVGQFGYMLMRPSLPPPRQPLLLAIEGNPLGEANSPKGLLPMLLGRVGYTPAATGSASPGSRGASRRIVPAAREASLQLPRALDHVVGSAYSIPSGEASPSMAPQAPCSWLVGCVIRQPDGTPRYALHFTWKGASSPKRPLFLGSLPRLRPCQLHMWRR